MISFYPGPSRVDQNIPEYVYDAYHTGILSINHRSRKFTQLCRETIELLKKKLVIPEDYTIVFTSSATECWEIIAQSLTDEHSYHFYNGQFGQKWFNYTKKLKYHAIGYQFGASNELKTAEIDLSSEAGTICITHNETSNGTQVSVPRIAKLRSKYPDHLIAVDATSSMAGVFLDFKQADIWFASVQKCFGLPAGMAIMICSPAAIKTASEIQENKHYNSFNFLVENIQKYQTPYTPNVLNIYLLNRVMAERKRIDKIEKRIHKRREAYEEIIINSSRFSLHVSNKHVRSDTVIVVEGKPEDIVSIKKKAEKAGFTLGNGYGQLKDTTFRIANFPSLKKNEVKDLRAFLKKNV